MERRQARENKDSGSGRCMAGPETAASRLLRVPTRADSNTGASKGTLIDNSCQLSTLIGRPTASLATAIAAVMLN